MLDTPAIIPADQRQAWAHTRAQLADMLEMAPGPTLIAALTETQSWQIDAAGSLIRTKLWGRVRAWVDAQSMIDVANTIDGPGNLPGIDIAEACRIAAQEIASAHHLSVGAARDTVDLSQALLHLLPLAWEALDRGDWSLNHVKALEAATNHCPARIILATDEFLVPIAIARGWTPGTVRVEAAKIILRLDPEGAADRAAERKKTADISFRPEPDEMSSITAYGDAVTGRQIVDTIAARAAQMRADGDDRLDGARRFGALSEFVIGRDITLDDQSATEPTEPTEPTDTVRRCQQLARRSGEALVRVDLATVLGDNDDPGELDGYGPISAATARRFAKDATWRRMVTDPISGELHHLSTHRYAPTEDIRRWVETRDRICQFAGCRQPARRCQIDHRTPDGDGGPTCICNLQPLCLMHHQGKTKKWYSCTIDANGVTTWRTPLGFSYLNRRRETYTVPRLDPIDPPADRPDFPPPATPLPASAVDPPYPNEPFPPEPPLDSYEQDDLYDALYNSWGSYQQRAFNLLRAAQLVD